MFKLRPFFFFKSFFLSTRCLLLHSCSLENKTLQCSEKKVGVGAVLGGRSGGVFNFAVTPPIILLVTPISGEGVACVEVWVSQGWAVAAGSWALTTYVLQLQPEL